MITNGTVTIEDGNKGEPGDFNPRRKVSVSISFGVPEDVTESAQSQIYLDTAASMASAKVEELLGRGAPRRATVTAEVKIETPAVETAAPKTRKKAEPKPDKAAQAEALGLPTTDTVHKGNPPSQIDLEELTTEPAKPAAVEDELGDLLGDSAPAPITDAELAKAAQTKNGLMKQKAPDTWQPNKIRELVVEYAGAPPKKITDVPVAKRHEFLAKLEALS